MLTDTVIGGNLKLHIIELDLADLESVRTFASQVQAFLNGKKLDMLVRQLLMLQVSHLHRIRLELSYATTAS